MLFWTWPCSGTQVRVYDLDALGLGGVQSLAGMDVETVAPGGGSIRTWIRAQLEWGLGPIQRGYQARVC